MKKILILLLVLILIPTNVLADTSANGTGDAVNFDSGSSGGSGHSTGCGYFLQNDNGLRITFYSLEGKKLGRSIDVFAASHAPSAGYLEAIKSGGKDTGFAIYKTSYTQWKHGAYDSSGSLRSRIDYINKGMNSVKYVYEYGCSSSDHKCMKNNNYYVKQRYYDMKSATYNSSKGDTLLYLKYNGRDYTKEYFLKTDTILRYSDLAGANITQEKIENGSYYILIEPVIHLEVLSGCGSRKEAGFYTSTEIGLLNKANSSIMNSTRIREVTVKKALRLSESQTIGNYSFVSEENLIQANSSYSPAASRLTDKVNGSYYGYGMMIVKGTEADDYIDNQRYRIVYHTISLATPFLNLDGTKRTLSPDSNWYNRENVIDANIYSKAPFLVVTLTPTQIKAIREDNKKINYAEIPSKYASGETFATSQFKKDFGL